VKEVSSFTWTTTSSQKMGPPVVESQASHIVSKVAHQGLSGGSSSRVAELGVRLRLSHLGMTKSGIPIYSSVRKSQLGYSWRVKKKIGKQLNKNKKLLAKTVEDTPVVRVEGYSKGVLDVMEHASNLGLTFGGDEKRLSDLFLVIEEDRFREEDVSFSNTKGKREIKNLECSINFEARGCGTSRVKGRVV
jgi:hypothetical protein